MSFNGLVNPQFPLTIDGLSTLNTDSLTINGQQINLTDYVPYSGANKTLNMGAQNIKTTHYATDDSDVVNNKVLTDAVAFITSGVSNSYLNKITSSSQTVVAPVEFQGALTLNQRPILQDGLKLNSATTGNWTITVEYINAYTQNLVFKNSTSGNTIKFTGDYAFIKSTSWTPQRVTVINSSGELITSSITDTELSYLSGIASNIQTQLNGKLSLSGGTMTGDIGLGANKITSTATPVTADTLTRKGYVDSAITTATSGFLPLTGGTLTGALTCNSTVSVNTRLLGQVDNTPSGNFWIGLRGSGTETNRLAISIAGADGTGVVSSVTIAKPLYLSDPTVNRVLGIDSLGKVFSTIATTTEIGYLSGVNNSIQVQIDTKANTSALANYLPLTGGTITGNLTVADGLTTNLSNGLIVSNTNLGYSVSYLVGYSTGGVTSGTVSYNSSLQWYIIQAGSTSGAVQISGFTPVSGAKYKFTLSKLGGGQSGQTIQWFQGSLSAPISPLYSVPFGSTTNFVGYFTPSNIGGTVFLLIQSPTSSNTYIFLDVGGGGTGFSVSRMDTNISGLLTGASATLSSLDIAGTLTTLGNVGIGTTNMYLAGINFPNNGTGLTWGPGYSRILDDSQLRICTDDAMYFYIGSNTSTYGTQKMVLTNSGLDVSGALSATSITSTAWGRAADYRSGMTPSNQAASSMGFYFGTLNNNNSTPYADLLCLNSWTDSSAGAVNLLAFNKGAKGIRQYQGTYGSGSAFSTWYDCVMTDANSGNVVIGGILTSGPNSSSKYLTVGASTTNCQTSANAQVICTNGNLHLDAAASQNIYFNYYQATKGNLISYGTFTHNGIMNVAGDTPSAVPSGYMSRGSLTIGSTNQNYGWGTSYWSSNTAGLLLECQDLTEIAVHDSGERVASLLAYAGGSGRNYIYMGRDMGWGVSRVITSERLGAYNTDPLMLFGFGGGNTSANISNTAAWTSGSNAMLITQTATQTANSAALCMGITSEAVITALAPNILWVNMSINASQITVRFNGTTCSTTNAGGWANVSDAREKEDIQPLNTEKSLKRVLALKGKNYRRRYDPNAPTPVADEIKQRRHIGFIAQDVAESNPHCLHTWCNEDAKSDDDDGTRYALSYDDYIVHLVGAVQEQQKQISSMTIGISNMTQKIETLQERNKVLEEHARELENITNSYKQETNNKIEKLASILSQLLKK